MGTTAHFSASCCQPLTPDSGLGTGACRRSPSDLGSITPSHGSEPAAECRERRWPHGDEDAPPASPGVSDGGEPDCPPSRTTRRSSRSTSVRRSCHQSDSKAWSRSSAAAVGWTGCRIEARHAGTEPDGQVLGEGPHRYTSRQSPQSLRRASTAPMGSATPFSPTRQRSCRCRPMTPRQFDRVAELGSAWLAMPTPAPRTDRLGRCGQVAGTARPCWPNRRREPVAVMPGQSSGRAGAPRLGGTRCQAICLAAIAGSISGSDRLPSTTGTVSTPVWASSAARRFARSTSRA